MLSKNVINWETLRATALCSRWAGLILLSSAGPVWGAERVVQIVPPGQIGFNYPSAPLEGEAEYFSIADNGEPRCVIVHSADASRAAKATTVALAQYLNLVTGGRIRVIDDSAEVPNGMGAIHVGDTDVGRTVELALPDLQYGDKRVRNVRGYLIKTLSPRILVMRGGNETATNHAVVGFLRRYAGVRQYWPGVPGGPGDVIPRRPTLSVPQVVWRDWPYYVSFQMSMRPFGSRRPALDFYRRHGTLPPGENYDDWLPPSRYAEDHPEYYALVNGRRLAPKDSDGAKGWQPCVSNPDVQECMGRAVLQYFRDHPEALGINFSINDGGGDCTCANCRALDAAVTDYSRGIGMSDRYVLLSNRVCEIVGREFPDKWIVYLAYAAASRAPAKVKAHPMLLPVLTTPNTFQRWDEWVEAGAAHLGHYVHHNDTFAILPKMDVRQNARRILYEVGSGKARTFYMEAHTQWPFGDVVPYVTSELLWDPRRDVDELLDTYFAKFYGDASEPMRDYYGVLQQGYERWLAEAGTPHWFGRDISSSHQNRTLEQFRVLSPQEADRAAAALQTAARQAANDPAVSERIQIIAATFALQKLALEQAWAAFRLRDDKPHTEQDARRAIEDARLVYDRSHHARRHIENVLEQPPCDHWKLFRSSTRPLERYEQLKSGTPGPEIRSAVSTGFYRAEEFLLDELGSERAGAWWRACRRAEDAPALTAALEAAERRALTPDRENLIADPGFEQIGREMAGEQSADRTGIILEPDQVRKLGIHMTFPDRTPYRCVLTSDNVHDGRIALMLEHCSRARFSRHVSAEPGARYRAGLWFRHNEGAARRYAFAVDARLKSRKYCTLSTLLIPNAPGEWRQYVIEVLAPSDATTIFLRLYAENQAADARCWIDDLFIDRW